MAPPIFHPRWRIDQYTPIQALPSHTQKTQLLLDPVQPVGTPLPAVLENIAPFVAVEQLPVG